VARRILDNFCGVDRYSLCTRNGKTLDRLQATGVGFHRGSIKTRVRQSAHPLTKGLL